MKELKIITILTLFALNVTFGQDREKYATLVQEASGLYDAKDYLKSGEKYSEAFVALRGRGVVNDRYNAACSWALANKPDSAFVQLFKIANNGNYSNYAHITADTDLISLHQNAQWENVIAKIKANKDEQEKDLDKTLVGILDSIYKEDQTYRKQIEDVEEKFGRDSKELISHWKLINEKDSINLIKVTKLLDDRGWLGPKIIGNQGNSTLFLVIQHADIKTQEKYLPMMREAVKKGDANASSLALLEDRVALRNGKSQIFGSQIGRDNATGEYYLLPLMDPDNVDKRRAEVGLGTIQDYISNWKLKWDVEEYKKKLPEIEAKQKK